MALASGTRLGPYEVTAQIGVGGMGEVYRATDTSLGRQVAIKVLPDAVAQDADRLARFDREARTLAALNHPNIAAIYGLERSNTTTALVMELVEGPTLADRIAQGAIPVDEALPIAKQIAEALEAAHEQGIVHRDLKPANIKVRPDGTVKVLDFGLAKAMEPAAGSSPTVSQSPTITTPAMTQMGMILGTAAYMSPEQARGKSVDKRSDIWAFGCVLYEMLTGRRAFDGEDVGETLARVIEREPDWSLLPAALPADVKKIVRRCLTKNSRQRLPDLGVARLDLSEVLPVQSQEPSVLRHDEARRPRRVATVVVGLLTAALSGAGLATLLSRGESSPVIDPPLVRVTVAPNQIFLNPGVTEVAVSPDGRHLVYVDGEGAMGRKLWLYTLASGERRELPGTEGAGSPFWSTDSTAVGFWAGQRIKRTSITGGVVESIAQPPTRESVAGSWSSDGTLVYGGATTGGLVRLAGPGSSPAQLTSVDVDGGETAHLFPQFLPDDRHVLFLVEASDPDRRGMFVVSLDTPGLSRVLAVDSRAVYASPGYLLAGREQTLVAYPFDADTRSVTGEPIGIAERVGVAANVRYASISASSNGVLALGGVGLEAVDMVWADRRGQRLARLGSTAGHLQVRLSPDETKVLTLTRDQKTNTNDLWLVDLSSGVFSKESTRNGDPVWAPDGRRLAFYRSAAGGNAIITAEIGNDREVTVPNAVGNTEDWTKDGQNLIVRSRGAVNLVSLEGKVVELLPRAEFERNELHLSPDGRWIAYTSTEGGTREVFLAVFPNFEQRRQVSTAGGDVPRWRKDQRELFYLSNDGQMMSVSVRLGDTIETEAPKALFPTRIVLSGGFDQYAVTGDGQRFLLLEPPESAAAPPITVLSNLHQLLRP